MEPLEPLGVDAVVTTREGGVSTGPFRSLNLALHVGDEPSRVLENRRRALTSLGAGLEDLVLGEQVHGAEVAVVDGSARGRGATTLTDAVPTADAIVTAHPGTVLGVLVADCVPIVIVDPAARVLACVHAGWRGTAGAVVDRALDAMVELGGAASASPPTWALRWRPPDTRSTGPWSTPSGAGSAATRPWRPTGLDDGASTCPP